MSKLAFPILLFVSSCGTPEIVDESESASLSCAAGIVRACATPACPTPPAADPVCADYIAVPDCGGCGYYACREASGRCGADGYYLGFAEKYCRRFLSSLRPR